MIGLTHDRIAGSGAIARILAFTPPILFGLIAATRVFPETKIAHSVHRLSWIALAAFAALVLAKPAYAAAEKSCSIIVAMALANGAVMVFGGYHCWGLFDSVCSAPGHVQSLRALADWSTVYANSDTYTYLVPFDGFSLRPSLYYLFSKIVLLFHVDSDKLLQEANGLFALGLQSPNDLGDNVTDKTRHLADAMSAQKYPSLLRLAQAQKVLLWASTIYFAIAAMRVIPPIFAAMALLALFDGGYLTHWYYIHAIESKTLYLACFFATAAASLACMRAPEMRNLFVRRRNGVGSSARVRGDLTGRGQRGSRVGVPTAELQKVGGLRHCGYRDIHRDGRISDDGDVFSDGRCSTIQYICNVSDHGGARAGDAARS